MKQWFTSRSLVDYISLGRLRVYSEVHDPSDSYYSYRSWNNGSRVVQLVNCISLGRLRVYSEVHDPYDSYDSYGSCGYTDVHDPHDSYDSYGSWNNGSQVVHLVNCILTLERLRAYDSCDSYGSWNNGLRVVPLVNYMSLERLYSESVLWSPRPVRLVGLVRVVKQWFTSRSVCELYIIRGT